jgi:hypothetical protein
MSTASVRVQHVSRLKPKYLLFAFVGLMLAYVLRHNESFLIDPKAPVWQHYQPFKWWLLPHGLAGAWRSCWARCSSPTVSASAIPNFIVS